MFNPVDFHALSKEILTHATTYEEALRRTQISRCYYAAHLVAREKVRRYYPSLLMDLKRLGDEHFLVREKLAASVIHWGISSMLLGLNQRRAKADYNLNAVVTKAEAEKAIEESEAIIAQVANIKSL